MVSGSLLRDVRRLSPLLLLLGACVPRPTVGSGTGGSGTGEAGTHGVANGGAGNTNPGAGGRGGVTQGMDGGVTIINVDAGAVTTGAGGTMAACSLGGGTGATMSRSLMPPTFTASVTQTVAPPAVSGGTLRVLEVYIVDSTSRTLRATLALSPGDEPGRVIEDGAGRVHVALRRGGAVVTIDVAAGMLLARRAVCASPRGLAYDAASDLVHVACADGELVSLPAAGGAATRTLRLDRDLRDVVVDGTRLRVSRFKTAELLTVEADGRVSGRVTPPGFRAPSARSNQLFTAGVAWRTMALPDGSTMMLHQRGVVDEIMPVPGGYGSSDPCSSIVHPTVTTVAPDGAVVAGAAVAGLVLAVDAAVSADGKRIAFVSPGNSTNQQLAATAGQLVPARVFMTDMSAVRDSVTGCKPDGISAPCVNPKGVMPTPATDGGVVVPPPTCQPTTHTIPSVVGEPIAIAFLGDGSLIVQSREPAMMVFGNANGATLALSTTSRIDTGHQVFHANAGGNIACASCHAEGNDDGRVWNFGCVGARRTQSLQTGLRGTEPFHWIGDEANLDVLMRDVFVGRMSGIPLSTDQSNRLLDWLDAQPKPARSTPTDPDAVARGRVLFNDAEKVGCVSCHAGARFSNNQSMDVGTGAAFQVPSLVGIGTRGPFMHNGCAQTLRDRFNPSCGGNKHGGVADLTSGQLSDLIAYLESI
jgi:hypothetical protein